MRASTARRTAHGVWLTTAVLWGVAVILVLASSPSEAIGIALLGLPMATYGSIGALVARKSPENPIGWLLSSVGLALAIWMVGLAYAQIGVAAGFGMGDLPGAAIAAWVGVLCLIAVLPMVLPLFLLYFPDGHLRSRRWRPVSWAVALGGVLLIVGSLATTWSFEPLVLAPRAWALRIPWVEHAYVFGLVLAFATAFAGLLALTLRFREAGAEQRQTLRLLVAMLVAMAIATAIAIVTVAVSGGAEWSWIAIVLAILIDGFGVLIGIPLAAAAAVLTFGLYDVGVVVKKTVVYVLLVVFFLGLLMLISLTLAPLILIRGAGGTTEGGAARIVISVSVAAVLLVVGFRPARRLAHRAVYGRRSTPYEAMNEFADRLGDTYSTDEVLPRMAEIVRASTGALVARVWLHVVPELRPIASAPVGAPDMSAITVGNDGNVQIPDHRVFPVRDRGELLGALTVLMPQAEPLSKTGERLVTDLAGQAGLVLRNVRLVEELQESRRRIVAAQDERARKLERDLHDGAQQQLVALSVKQRLAASFVGKDDGRARAMLDELQLETNDALENLRDLARGIYPPLLADRGLAAALEGQARKSAIPVEVRSEGVGRYDQEVESAVYFSILEAMQNVSKYAEAGGATVTLSRSNGLLSFEIVDDGRGFDAANVVRGMGLRGMADRIEAVGGRLAIESSPGSGTRISGVIEAEEARSS